METEIEQQEEETTFSNTDTNGNVQSLNRVHLCPSTFSAASHLEVVNFSMGFCKRCCRVITKGQTAQTGYSGFVLSVCYPCLCLLGLIGAGFHLLNMLNWCLLGLGRSEK